MPLYVLLLHPLTEAGALPVPPIFLATVLSLVALLASAPPARPSQRSHEPSSYLAQPLPVGALLGRGAAVLVLGGLLVAAQVGARGSAQHIAPALVVGVGWPLLVLACALVPGLWARIDPWDGLARSLEQARIAAPDTGETPADVRWALLPALAVAWYLSTYRGVVAPRSVGAALGVYGLVTVAGCLAMGRRTWLARAEPVGLFLRWVGLLPQRALGSWQAPRAAAALLGVIGAGLLFGAVRLSAWWGRFLFTHQGQVLDTVGFAMAAGAGGILLFSLDRSARRRGAGGAMAATMVPLVAAIALAVSMIGGRAINAAQLLVRLISDPLGYGWDLFGTATWSVRPYPLSPGWHVVVQLVMLTVGGVLGARAARAQTASSGQGALASALAGLCGLLAAAVLALTVL